MVNWTAKDSGVMISNLWLWRNGELSQWTFGDNSIARPEFSPDGNWLAFLAKTSTGKRDDWRRSKLFWLSVDEPKTSPRLICEREGAQTSTQFSPDGAKVAFLSWREPERSFSHHRLLHGESDLNTFTSNSQEMFISIPRWCDCCRAKI